MEANSHPTVPLNVFSTLSVELSRKVRHVLNGICVFDVSRCCVCGYLVLKEEAWIVWLVALKAFPQFTSQSRYIAQMGVAYSTIRGCLHYHQS